MMEVILLEKIHNLGDLGEQVKIKPGYGRNYLIPQGKAVPATPDNVAKFAEQRAKLEKKAAERLAVAQDRANKLADLNIEIAAKVSDESRLYGSIGPSEISEAITGAGIEVQKSEVRMPLGPIREIGEYEIELELHSDVLSKVKLTVIAEQ